MTYSVERIRSQLISPDLSSVSVNLTSVSLERRWGCNEVSVVSVKSGDFFLPRFGTRLKRVGPGTDQPGPGRNRVGPGWSSLWLQRGPGKPGKITDFFILNKPEQVPWRFPLDFF